MKENHFALFLCFSSSLSNCVKGPIILRNNKDKGKRVIPGHYPFNLHSEFINI